MAQKKCGNCGWTDNRPPFMGMRWHWYTFMCPCGISHDFCGFCYKALKARGVIVSRGQRGGGKKESLKSCPRDLWVADVLMRK